MSRTEMTMREVLLADMYEEQIDRLTAELSRYREALEFYADEGNWYIRFGGNELMTFTGSSACDADNGNIARKVLKEEV